MANALVTQGKVRMLGHATEGIDLINDTIKAVLVDHGVDTPVPATDIYLSDITAGARVATSAALANKTTTGGVFDADDITLSLVTGASCESIVLYKDSGNPATSPLIAVIDTMTGLPVTPNGGDIILQWANDANKIFAI